MSKNKSLLGALLTMLLWGLLFPLSKLGFFACNVSGTADILLFAGIRFVVSGGVIAVYAAIRDKDSYRPAGKCMGPILASGLIAIVLHYSFNYMGLELTASSKTALLKQVGPLLYICFSFLFFKEDKPTVRKIVAGGLGFLGIIALNLSSSGFSFGIGDVLILGASMCTVVSSVISKKVFQTVDPITATGIFQFFGGVVLVVCGAAMGGSVSMNSAEALWIMGCICAASIVSYCLWYGIIKHGELSKLFIIKFSEPVFACVFGAILLGENIWRLQYLAAFLLIGGGIWISNRDKKN